MRAQRSRRLQGWLFIGPALLFVAVFVLIPLGQLAFTSLTDRSLLGGGRFVGFENYLRIWRDSSFWRALAFTVQYTIVALMQPRYPRSERFAAPRIQG